MIPESGTSPREGNGNPLQYSCLENPTDRGAWWATVHGIPSIGQDLATKPYGDTLCNLESTTQIKYIYIYVYNIYTHICDFPDATVVKNPPAKAGDVRDASLISGSGRSLEEKMATYSSILA